MSNETRGANPVCVCERMHDRWGRRCPAGDPLQRIQHRCILHEVWPPASSYSLNNRDTLHTWQERARYWTSPGTVTTTMIGNLAVSNVDPGTTHLQQCQLKIVAGQDGQIKTISVLSDSLGKWQMSRCNELFSSR